MWFLGELVERSNLRVILVEENTGGYPRTVEQIEKNQWLDSGRHKWDDIETPKNEEWVEEVAATNIREDKLFTFRTIVKLEKILVTYEQSWRISRIYWKLDEIVWSIKKCLEGRENLDGSIAHNYVRVNQRKRLSFNSFEWADLVA